MGTENVYRPGSFYRLCDRTGFATRAGRTQKQWDGLYVRDRSYEARQPQDFVRGVLDDQSVPDPRPRQPNLFTTLTTTLNAAAALGATSVTLAGAGGIQDGDSLLILLDSQAYFATTAAGAPAGAVVTLAAPLPYGASSGNNVIDTTYRDPAQNPANFPASDGNGSGAT